MLSIKISKLFIKIKKYAETIRVWTRIVALYPTDRLDREFASETASLTSGNRAKVARRIFFKLTHQPWKASKLGPMINLKFVTHPTNPLLAVEKSFLLTSRDRREILFVTDHNYRAKWSAEIAKAIVKRWKVRIRLVFIMCRCRTLSALSQNR